MLFCSAVFSALILALEHKMEKKVLTTFLVCTISVVYAVNSSIASNDIRKHAFVEGFMIKFFAVCVCACCFCCRSFQCRCSLHAFAYVHVMFILHSFFSYFDSTVCEHFMKYSTFVVVLIISFHPLTARQIF